MLRIAVVVEDNECSSALKLHIDRYCKEKGEEARVISFSDGIDIVSDYSAGYDVIFLDVAMKHMDGIQAAKYIRMKDKNVIIVLIADDIRYALKGYSVEALCFMLKPFSYSAFCGEFSRCMEKVNSVRGNFIILATENGVDRVAVDGIVYIESQNHKMIINTVNKPYCVYETMRSLEGRLPAEQFARCNNCYLVNLDYITGVHGEYVSIAGRELKISRSRRKTFLENISAFYS